MERNIKMSPKHKERPLSSPESPTSQQGKTKMPKDENDNLLDAIQTMFGKHAIAINDGIDKSIEKLRLYMEEKLGFLEDKLKALSEENDKLQIRNTALEDRVTTLEREGQGQTSLLSGRIVQLERDARQLNIVVSGIEFETPKQGYVKLNKMINTVTEEKINVVGLRAFKTQSGRGMIVAACRNMEEKLCILRAKKKFVSTEGDEIKPVYIDNDLHQQDRVVQGRLRSIAKEEREKGKDVKVALGKIKIDGEWLHFNIDTNNVEPR